MEHSQMLYKNSIHSCIYSPTTFIKHLLGYNRELNSTILALMELAVWQIGLTSKNHTNKC